MNIWLITIGELLPLDPKSRKLRTSYLADELVARGHKVTWWASAFDHFNKKWLFNTDKDIDLSSNFQIKIIKGTGYNKNISLQRLIDHRVLAKKFSIKAKTQPKPDVILVSMPTYELSYAAVKYANKYGIPVIVDIRDQWPDLFVKRLPLPKFISRILLWQEFSMLKKALRNATGITAVSNDYLNWGISYTNRDKLHTDKVFYLGYKKNDANSSNLKDFENKLNKIKDKFIIVFIGTFEVVHDPRILIDCAEHLQSNQDIHFVLAGTGSLMPEIQERVKKLDNVTITGWLGQQEIDLLLSHSNVGVCTSNQNIDLFPNKAFSYCAYGLPVISSFSGELKNLSEQLKFGFYYNPNNLLELKEIILSLKNNNELYKSCSENSINSFKEIFDGNNIYKSYANHLESLVK